MSKAAWITLGLSSTFTTSLIYLVHRQQRVEKKAMRAGIEAEDEKRRNIKADQDRDDAEATKRRLEKNQQDFELQQKVTQDLLSKN